MQFVRRVDLIGKKIRVSFHGDAKVHELVSNLVLDITHEAGKLYGNPREPVLIIYCIGDDADESFSECIYVALGTFKHHISYSIKREKLKEPETRHLLTKKIFSYATDLGLSPSELMDTIIGNAPTGEPAQH